MRQYKPQELATKIRELIQTYGGQVSPSGAGGLEIAQNGQTVQLPRQDAQVGSRGVQNR